MYLELSFNRRQLFRVAAGTFFVAAARRALAPSAVCAQSADAPRTGAAADASVPASPAKQPSAESPAPPAAAASDQDAPQTGEGIALADAALAAAGHTLPADSAAEVRKQLGSYPGSFHVARKFPLANADAPQFGVTPQN